MALSSSTRISHPYHPASVRIKRLMWPACVSSLVNIADSGTEDSLNVQFCTQRRSARCKHLVNTFDAGATALKHRRARARRAAKNDDGACVGPCAFETKNLRQRYAAEDGPSYSGSRKDHV